MSADAPVPYPASLIRVDTWEVQYKAFRMSDPSVDNETFELGFGRSEWRESDRTIDAVVTFESGKKEGGSNYYLRIEVRGRFSVTTSKYSAEQIQRWAERQAPVVLMPFLREQVYSFTIRTGFKPVLVPMVQVPTPIPESAPTPVISAGAPSS